NIVMNCGYGRGSSVLEVIETVKRISGVDFDARMAERRAGDPSELVAGTSLIRERLPWKPEFDDLDVIIEHALNWERKLKGNKFSTNHAAE
ncbi:MAG TPA: UDP-glucose 4-epimerase GalE, partial [Hyphomicrobiales bacterium]|nr:UDP-glucose 4-epimerase GalE [Hyphomicrobiales bacterium]